MDYCYFIFVSEMSLDATLKAYPGTHFQWAFVGEIMRHQIYIKYQIYIVFRTYFNNTSMAIKEVRTQIIEKYICKGLLENKNWLWVWSGVVGDTSLKMKQR